MFLSSKCLHKTSLVYMGNTLWELRVKWCIYQLLFHIYELCGFVIGK